MSQHLLLSLYFYLNLIMMQSKGHKLTTSVCINSQQIIISLLLPSDNLKHAVIDIIHSGGLIN
jgi:hypothetical protein